MPAPAQSSSATSQTHAQDAAERTDNDHRHPGLGLCVDSLFAGLEALVGSMLGHVCCWSWFCEIERRGRASSSISRVESRWRVLAEAEMRGASCRRSTRLRLVALVCTVALCLATLARLVAGACSPDARVLIIAADVMMPEPARATTELAILCMRRGEQVLRRIDESLIATLLAQKHAGRGPGERRWRRVQLRRQPDARRALCAAGAVLWDPESPVRDCRACNWRQRSCAGPPVRS